MGILEGLFSNIILIVVVIFLILVIISNVKIVSQAQAYIIENLGSYKTTWTNGLHFKIPFFERIAGKISLKEQVVDFAPQPVITKDNVTIQIDTVIYFAIVDPKLFVYGVNSPLNAIENLTATTLRNIIGDLELDESLTSRDHINSRMRIVLDEATDAWGIKINRVELKNIVPPVDIQQAMEKQMRAEREKRESILRAEGTKAAEILNAEGERASTILRAEAAKEAVILQATASREAQILEAEGQAEAILKINTATALGLEKIKAVDVNDRLIALKSLESLEKMADGQATKIIIPSEIQSLAGLAASLKSLIEEK